MTMEQREAGTERSGFHTTNPFGSGITARFELNGVNGSRTDITIAAIISEIMSDYIPSQEQIVEIAAATSQPSSSRASPDSTNSLDGAETIMQNDARHPLEVTDYSLENWPNSNNGQTSEPNPANGTIELTRNLVTPVAAPRTPAIKKDPLCPQKLTRSIGENPFLNTIMSTGGSVEQAVGESERPRRRESVAIHFLNAASVGSHHGLYHYKSINPHHKLQSQYRNRS